MDKPKKIIGRAENVDFPALGLFKVPARVDTGARTSTIWASQIQIDENGTLSFCLFDESSPYFTNHTISTKSYSKIVVASSMGTIQKRYKIRLFIKLKGKKIHASFTLADRSQQAFPILIGRNILKGKFVVDVKKTKKTLKQHEKSRINSLQEMLEEV